MEIDLNVLGKQQVDATTGTKEMSMSKHAQSMVFQLFTKNVYSNPIGTVVREITSNCFDSHIEAGIKNAPVLIKKTYDEQTDTNYISFIDYGVGMSQHRVENIYGVYFESSKRANNNEIGGFGIGGKTPLAYKRYAGEGEGEYDNSFFVITNYDGIKYYYNVFEGPKSPQYICFHQEKTNERNGTEIRIPVLQRDIDKFESELVRQLYYFDGIVFEGFSDEVKNDYQIINGKNFLYRGEDVDDYMHISLGNVYYPINYNVLGLSKYDYDIPVAIKVPIGKIGVTVSRENLDYSEQTIKYLKKRIDETFNELKQMLTDQYQNVQTLEDYFNLKDNYGKLHLTDNKFINLGEIIKQSTIDLSNYKYAAYKTPQSSVLYELFFTTKTFGKKETMYRGSDKFHKLSRNYKGVLAADNLYYSETQEYQLKRIKQAYLKNVHGRFYLLLKNNLTEKWATVCDIFNVHFDTKDDFINSTMYKKLSEMQEEFFNIVRKNNNDYNVVEIPDDFKLNYGRPKLTTDILKTTIPIRVGWSKERVKIEDLVKFKGKIFFGTPDDERLANEYRSVFKILFNSKYLADDYWRGSFGNQKGIMIITVAKNNIKYLKYCKNAYPMSEFYYRIVRRKEDIIINQLKNDHLIEKFNRIEINRLFSSDIMNEIAPEWYDKIHKVKKYINSLSTSYRDVKYHRNFFANYIDLTKIKQSDNEKLISTYIDDIYNFQNKNEDALRYINIPYHFSHLDENEKDILIKILKSVMSFN